MRFFSTVFATLLLTSFAAGCDVEDESDLDSVRMAQAEFEGAEYEFDGEASEFDGEVIDAEGEFEDEREECGDYCWSDEPNNQAHTDYLSDLIDENPDAYVSVIGRTTTVAGTTLDKDFDDDGEDDPIPEGLVCDCD